MGFHVSTLHNLPTGNITHFVHVLDLTNGLHGRWIAENLHTLARDFGATAGLVTGPDDLSNELYQFLVKNIDQGFQSIEKILRFTTCLVISEGHLRTTNGPVYLLPLASSDDTTAAREMIDTLLSMLATAIKTNTLDELVISLGAHQIELTQARGSLVVCTLRELNKVVELKPNVAGFGFNLNALVEKLLPPEVRAL